MLELPEAETLRRDLEADVVGRKIVSVMAKSTAALPHHKDVRSFATRVEGAKVKGVRRRGAVLVAALDNDHSLVIDVAGGWLRLFDAADIKAGRDKRAEAAFRLDNATSLAFGMWATTGSLGAYPTGEVDQLARFAAVGFDPIDVPVSWTVLAQALMRRPGPIKALLAEGTVMAGIGDVYSDEILFAAGIRHDRDAARLSPQEIRRLYRAVIEVLHESIRRRGAAVDFVDLRGRPGQYELSVFGRDGQVSPRGRAVVRKTKFEGRFTYFCETQV